MKNSLFKRVLAILLAVVMVLGLAACGDDSGSGSRKKKDPVSQETQGSGAVTEPAPPATEPAPPATEPKQEPAVDPAAVTQADSLSAPNMRYVMIYNPKVYDENGDYDLSSMKVGSLGAQIDVNTNRADGLEEEPAYTSISQREWLAYFGENINLEGNRADVMGQDYAVGDIQYFYYSEDCSDMPNRRQAEFTCYYAGENCYVWAMTGQGDESQIATLGAEFDQNIYHQVTGVFGMPRFVGETGKVNILLYGISGSILGYFAPVDLFEESELSYVGLSGTTCNTGHAIININSRMLGGSVESEMLYGTVAHEFQHLINFSAALETWDLSMMNTWLNEAMSGYIEAGLYSLSKIYNGHYISLNDSDQIREGQSLYNFDTDWDIGMYGQVYFFSKYLEKIAGKAVFEDIMDYWRESYSNTLSTAEALAKCVPQSTYNAINKTVDYSPLKLSFNSQEEEWMSKLCLNYYLSVLSNDQNIPEFQYIDASALLYDAVYGTDIEGGGRLIVALNGNSFQIPEESDSGLIYVGLDASFRPVTGFVYK